MTYPWQNALRKLKWIKYKGTTTKTMAELDVLIGRRDRAPGAYKVAGYHTSLLASSTAHVESVSIQKVWRWVMFV